jgi:hypothetical protein
MGALWSRLFSSTKPAQAILTNANTNVLRNALRNYITAVKNLQETNRNPKSIMNMLNVTNFNVTKNTALKNRFTKGLAKTVVASKNALWVAKAAVNGAQGAPNETNAAEAVKNATANINKINAAMNATNAATLNRIMTKLIKNSGGVVNNKGFPASWDPSKVANEYIKVRAGKLGANRALNTGRKIRGTFGRMTPAPARWNSIFTSINKLIANSRKEINVPGRTNKVVLIKRGGVFPWIFENSQMNVNYRVVGANTNNPTVSTKANLNAAKQARAKAAAERLWGLAGTGVRNIGTAQKTATTIARNNGTLNLKNLTRANIEAILANTTFEFQNNKHNNKSISGGVRNAEHTKRVKNLLNHLGLKN